MILDPIYPGSGILSFQNASPGTGARSTPLTAGQARKVNPIPHTVGGIKFLFVGDNDKKA